MDPEEKEAVQAELDALLKKFGTVSRLRDELKLPYPTVHRACHGEFGPQVAKDIATYLNTTIDALVVKHGGSRPGQQGSPEFEWAVRHPQKRWGEPTKAFVRTESLTQSRRTAEEWIARLDEIEARTASPDETPLEALKAEVTQIKNSTVVPKDRTPGKLKDRRLK